MEYLLQETARENMTRPARTVAPELTVGDLLRLFASGDSDAYPVVRGEKLVGVVSRADAIKPFATKPGGNDHFDAIMGTTVQEIMSSRTVVVTLDAPLKQVVQLMKVYDFESFPVVDHENRVKGIIAREDVVRALVRGTCRSSLPLPLSPVGYAIA